jgi:sugar phosphate isomerase/epimerase
VSYLSLTTWSLHRSLGPLRWTRWDPNQKMQVTQSEAQPEFMRLVDLPAAAAAKGFEALDVCHFHIPDTSDSALRTLRKAFEEANLKFYTLLLDYGDISSSDEIRRQSDIAYIKKWIDIAAKVGAERLRVVAGESDASDKLGLDRAAQTILTLLAYGREHGVKIITENFRSLTSTIENCLYLNEACEGQLRFIADFGNFKSASKYDDLAKLVQLAENIHGKANYDATGLPDVPEFEHCLDSVFKSNYNGPITIVYDGPGDEWDGIERVRRLVAPHLS